MRVLALAALLVAAACVNTHTERLGSAEFEPRPQDWPVAVFETERDIDREPWVKIGRVTATVSGSLVPQDAGIGDLKAAARRIGGDGIVLRELGTSMWGVASPYASGWIPTSDGGHMRQAMVIRFGEEAKNK